MKRKIGFLVAIEIDAVLEKYPSCRALDAPSGFRAYRIEESTCDLYVLRCGMGEIAAAAGAQYLITRFDVSLLFNFGVVGGLTADMSRHTLCVVERVVHYKYDCSEFLPLAVGQVDGHDSIFLPTDAKLLETARTILPELTPVTCCSGDKFIGTQQEKQWLHDTFSGDICDMESAGIVLTCETNGVPCLLFKAVSDGLAEGADGFFASLQQASRTCFAAAERMIRELPDNENEA